MKRFAMILVIAAIATLIVVSPTLAGTGNGAPSGAHYNLNIIGVPHDKTADMTGD